MMLGTVCPPLSPSFFSKLEFPLPSVSPSTSSSSSSSLLSRSSRASSLSSRWTHSSSLLLPAPSPHISSSPILRRTVDIVLCRATAEYKFPDPIPEFADAETDKFSAHLMKKLSKKDMFGDSIDEVVGICTEIFSTFLHSEYGGPGTLLVIPFIDMADTINERGLPGGPQAARAAVKWAQKHVDKDWNEWNVEGSS